MDFYLLNTFGNGMSENFDGFDTLKLARTQLVSRRIKVKLQN